MTRRNTKNKGNNWVVNIILMYEKKQHKNDRKEVDNPGDSEYQELLGTLGDCRAHQYDIRNFL